MASAAALTLIPHDQALAAWTRVATKLAPTNGLNDAQMAFVRAIADTIIPRTDTPSATDVGTEKFIDVIVAEYATDEDRTKFFAAIDALDAKSRAGQDAAVADLTPEARGKFIESVESGDRNVDPAQQYWRLKGLVIHGYFTSEQVMKDVLKVQVMPGRFSGSEPVKLKKRPLQAGSPAPKQEQMEEHHHG